MYESPNLQDGDGFECGNGQRRLPRVSTHEVQPAAGPATRSSEGAGLSFELMRRARTGRGAETLFLPVALLETVPIKLVAAAITFGFSFLAFSLLGFCAARL